MYIRKVAWNLDNDEKAIEWFVFIHPFIQQIILECLLMARCSEYKKAKEKKKKGEGDNDHALKELIV